MLYKLSGGIDKPKTKKSWMRKFKSIYKKDKDYFVLEHYGIKYRIKPREWFDYLINKLYLVEVPCKTK